MDEITVAIGPDGNVRFIYSDAAADAGLLTMGKATTRRVSHVEPNAAGQWEADMGPVGGPLLGPFERRQPALDAEVAWLQEHRGL